MQFALSASINNALCSSKFCRLFNNRIVNTRISLCWNTARSITCLIPSILFFGIAVQPAKAGCGSGAVQVWSIDVVTGRKTFWGKGQQSSCGNVHSSFEVVTLPEFRVSWEKCFTNCIKGAAHNEISVKINGISIVGNVVKLSGDITCVSQREKQYLYCWKY